ncbi:ComEC/Rec2 family competence protein [uncultured Litoreibacter sp.]|uniref:ComEC/Rec2 family competence protein n=1 Tax=uncultured Litoreibacter sp. TaxID=1392394 RepID=UPI00263364A3|nr:ComEC/Rec2 family competence protein [uncultured Litoreibacter sp.]
METRAGDVGQRPLYFKVLHGLGHAIDQQNTHLFPWAPVFFGIGVGLYFAMLFDPDWAQVAAVILAVGMSGGAVKLFMQQKPQWVVLLLWGISLSLAGYCAANLRAHYVAAPVLGFRYYGPIEGRIVAIDTSSSQKMRLTLDQVQLIKIPPARTPRKLRVSLHGPHIDIPYNPGDIVMTTGHLGPPSGPVEPGGFDFQRHLWFQQLGALGYTRNPMVRLAPRSDMGWRLWLYDQRISLSKSIKSRMPPTEGPFASAIVTGDRSDLDPELVKTLRASNLAHLLAISGLHMGLLTGAVFAIMRLGLAALPAVSSRWSIRKIAAIVSLGAALVYLGVSGANVATQRAFIMVGVMLLAICVERPAVSLRAVAIAALVILAISPESLIGPGFQMSFAATTALVATFSVVRDRGLFLSLPRWMSGPVTLLLSSFIAGVATAPFGAAHFNQVAQYGLLANLLSVPVMGFFVMPGALLAAALAPFGLEGVGLWIMEQGLAWILGVARFVAGLEGSTRAIAAPDPLVLPLISLGGLMVCLWQGKGRITGVIPICIALALWSGSQRPTVLMSESGRLIGILQGDKRALNKPKGDGFSARVWLENDGDPADQKFAAARGGFSANQLRFSVRETSFAFNAAHPDKIDLSKACGQADFVILPRLEAPLPKGCLGWSGQDFKAKGSVAIYEEEDGVRIENSRSRQGDRLWNSISRKPAW